MKRKPRSAQFKSQVALEALKNQKTINELAAEYGRQEKASQPTGTTRAREQGK
jgi:transposase-like protein